MSLSKLIGNQIVNRQNKGDLQGLAALAFAAESPPEWGQVVGNIGPSAKRLAQGVAHAVMHPVETASNIDAAIAGGIQNANAAIYERLPPAVAERLRQFDKTAAGAAPFNAIRRPAQDAGFAADSRQAANAVGQAMVERYGGAENVKRTVIQDPVGFLADVSTLLGGGAGLTARIPSIARPLAVAAKATDPVRLAARAAAPVARGAGHAIGAALGATTGAGKAAVREALAAGVAGGQRGRDFRASMRGKVAPDSVLQDAQTAMGNLAENRRAQYLANMQRTAASGTSVDVGPINRTLDELEKSMRVDMGNAGGNAGAFPPLSKASSSEERLMTEIGALVDQWSNHPQGTTPIGLDALRQRISKLAPDPSSPNAANERRIIAELTGAIADAVGKVEPSYKAALADYAKAKNLEREIAGSLALTGRANADTTLAKLQSAFSPTAGSRTPARLKAMQELEAAGAENLGTKLAGQRLAQVAPTGLSAKAVAGGLGASAFWNPAVLPAIASTSPRLVGEAAHMAGRGARRMPIPRAETGTNAARAARIEEAKRQRLQEQEAMTLIKARPEAVRPLLVEASRKQGRLLNLREQARLIANILQQNPSAFSNKPNRFARFKSRLKVDGGTGGKPVNRFAKFARLNGAEQ